MTGQSKDPAGARGLSAQTELLDDISVTPYILSVQVAEEAPTPPDELEKASPGMVVVPVLAEVVGDLADPTSQDSHLHLSRTGVSRMRCMLLDDLRFLRFVQRLLHPIL